ncbi:hypothetical protein [Pseudomonas kribbensis]|uniref:Uncharacterized protein n=1 Tax=Pseudomonas kribbensis TaxID=1628086 RepID=A0A4Y8VMS9_9PSED|nr:hypothetical protein [Pseudomonas kribbensis]TFH81820.1 hypothetical protein E4J90_09600 [Pseudomonas kribbensis]
MTSRESNKKLERLGFYFEIAGMIILLVASFWQVKMSGRLEASFVEWQSQIQKDVNLSVLSALSDIASLPSINDPAYLKSTSLSTSERASKAYSRVMDATNQRERELGGQVEWFSKVNFCLIVLGAILTLCGKIFSSRAIKTERE